MHDRKYDAVRDYLSSYRVLRKEVGHMEERIRRLERLCTKSAARITGIRATGPVRETQSLYDTLRELRGAALQTLEQALMRSREIEDLIARVEGTTGERSLLYRQVLTRRYLDGMTFDRIAADLHYHERHIRRLHNEGLAAAAKIYEREEDACEVE